MFWQQAGSWGTLSSRKWSISALMRNKNKWKQQQSVIWLQLRLSRTERLVHRVSSETNWSLQEAIRNKPLEEAASHVFNLFFIVPPAVVKQNSLFNQHSERVTCHKSTCVLPKTEKGATMGWAYTLEWQTRLVWPERPNKISERPLHKIRECRHVAHLSTISLKNCCSTAASTYKPNICPGREGI